MGVSIGTYDELGRVPRLKKNGAKTPAAMSTRARKEMLRIQPASVRTPPALPKAPPTRVFPPKASAAELAKPAVAAAMPPQPMAVASSGLAWLQNYAPDILDVINSYVKKANKEYAIKKFENPEAALSDKKVIGDLLTKRDKQAVANMVDGAKMRAGIVSVAAVAQKSQPTDAQIDAAVSAKFQARLRAMPAIEQARIAQIFQTRGEAAAKQDPVVKNLITAVQNEVAAQFGVTK